jgi:hypothetical protein
MRAYLHRLVLSGQSGGYARNFKSPGSWDATDEMALGVTNLSDDVALGDAPRLGARADEVGEVASDAAP